MSHAKYNKITSVHYQSLLAVKKSNKLIEF